MQRSWWVCLLALFSLGAGGASAAEKPYVIKVGPALVYLDAGAQQGVVVGDIYAVVRPEEEQDALVGLVTLIRVEEHFSIAEIGYRAEGEQFEILQRAMPLAEWEARPVPPQMHRPAPHPGAEAHAEEGRWSLHLTGGMERSEGENERSLGLALGRELSERVGLDLGFKMAGELPSERTQYIGELNAEFLPFGGEGMRPYVSGGPSLRQLHGAGQTALKWGGQVLGGVEVPLGRWQVRVEGGYQRVAVWSGVRDVSGWLGQVGVGMHF
ncbi:MAG: hypothetical protein HYW07_20865 [Candidatus Latescibacteria bacterium]|nr:hypothetical protein [Candidatus Latescibacterota bacterium]